MIHVPENMVRSWPVTYENIEYAMNRYTHRHGQDLHMQTELQARMRDRAVSPSVQIRKAAN